MEVKTFFMPGDLVTLKQDIPHKPIMIVVKKEVSLLKNKISLGNKNSILWNEVLK